MFTRAANVYGAGQHIPHHSGVVAALAAKLDCTVVVVRGDAIHIGDVLPVRANGTQWRAGEACHLYHRADLIRELIERVTRTFDLSLDEVAQQSEERLGKDDFTTHRAQDTA